MPDRPLSVFVHLAALVLAVSFVSGCGHAPPQTPGSDPPAVPPAAAERALPAEVSELRYRGIAELENEAPAEAEEIFRRLLERVPDDPLPRANLAIALLRQQRTDEALAAIDRALELAPGRADLLLVRGEILEWTGESEAALEAFEAAAAAAPDDPEVLYALLRQASLLGDDEAAAAALEPLARLRPENLVVLLEAGKQAIARGDRAAASAAFLRIGELLWGAPPIAATAYQAVVDALSGDPTAAAARVPAARLENVLRIAPAYRESLRELSLGIQGVPIVRFAGEPPPADFGPPVPVTFAGRLVASDATAGGALVARDFDDDGRADLARIALRESAAALEVRTGASGLEIDPAATTGPLAADPSATAAGLVAADLTNDGDPDLVLLGAGGAVVWAGGDGASFAPVAAGAPAALAEPGPPAAAAAAIDFDIEGDLDLVVATGAPGAAGSVPPVELWRNDLEGPLERVSDLALPDLAGLERLAAAVAADVDRDGDVDLLLGGAGGLVLLDNLRQGRFADVTAIAGLAGGSGAVAALVVGDLDGDLLPDVAAGGPGGVTIFRNTGEGFERDDRELPAIAGRPVAALVAFDADNDGRLDLAAGGAEGLLVLAHEAPGGWRSLPVEGGLAGAVTALAAEDFDGDGDLDLAAGGPGGLALHDNRGGDANGWLRVRLRGLATGNSKNNLAGAGASLELFAGAAAQYREHDGGVTHFGLGRRRAADVLRIVWTNGVPQNRLDVAGAQTVVEEQVLKGSCPFLYAWDGERMRFVTDLLWGSPLGLPVAPGVWVPADPTELVRVDGARPRPDGRYDLRITEELWEAAYFDLVRLWVVDHPEEVEVASALKIVPGGGPSPERVLASRELRPVAAALDGRGEDATARVAARDDVYASGFEKSPYQGVAAAPWSLTLDLGDAPGAPVRLHLDGWIFPADASLNLAVAQRGDLAPLPPRLEVETADGGWQVLMPSMGHPAGKTKTMVVDTPPLPPGARRLRIVTGQWLAWDRVAWTTRPADDAPRVVARLEPAQAELAFRGFSATVRRAPDAPHEADYARVTTVSPWLPFPGPYTRFGPVGELLAGADGRSVVMAPGDELALVFDASALPAPPAGWRRTVFLESHGWDKDADRNTWAVERGTDPQPWQGLVHYPPGEGDAPPDPAAAERYRREWLTRETPGPANETGAPAAGALAAPPLSTFSIVACDPDEGFLGVAVQSRVVGAGAIVPAARAGVGAIATQAAANVAFKERALELFAGGASAEEVRAALVASDPEIAHRQLAVVGADCRVAAHTGAETLDWAGHRTGERYSVQGNILTGPEVLEAMAGAFEAAEAAGRPFGERLLAALEAGQEAGGDRRGRQGAGLLIVKERGGYGGGDDRYADLRVEDHVEPILELARVYRVWMRLFHPEDHYLPAGSEEFGVPAGPHVCRLRELLARAGHGEPPAADARWCPMDAEVLRALAGFQEAAGLPVEPRVSDETAAALRAAAAAAGNDGPTG